jgi:hypothetical protein
VFDRFPLSHSAAYHTFRFREQLCRILGKSVLTAEEESKSPSADARCLMPDARFQDSHAIDLTLTLRAGMPGVAAKPQV